MRNMDCKTVMGTIDQLLERESIGQSARTHIAACVACENHLQLQDRLSALIGELERVDVPANFDASLRARIRVAGSRQDYGWLQFPNLRQMLVVSTCALILVCSVALLRFAGTSADHQLKAGSSVDSPGGAVNGVTQTEAARTPREDQTPAITKSDAGPRTSSGAGPHNRTRHSSREIMSQDSDANVASTDMAVTAAQNNLPPGISVPTPTASAMYVTVPVRTQADRFVINVNGAARSVTLKPVSFGAQEMVEPGGIRGSGAQRVW